MEINKKQVDKIEKLNRFILRYNNFIREQMFRQLDKIDIKLKNNEKLFLQKSKFFV